MDGDNGCSGRVEVLRHEHWGTVCNHDWDFREADVVCLELGCGLAESTPHIAEFGPGTGDIALHHVQCSGHESSLTRCAVVLHSIPFCTHDNDAGVKCSGEMRVSRGPEPGQTILIAKQVERHGCQRIIYA